MLFATRVTRRRRAQAFGRPGRHDADGQANHHTQCQGSADYLRGHFKCAKQTRQRRQPSPYRRRLELLHYKRTTDELRLDSTALTLEENRASYEMEIQSTLGDSMAQYTRAEWLAAKNEFDIATTWAQIDILTGKKIYQQRGE